MENVKRWYIYATNAVSLHAVVWAVITLLRRMALAFASTGSQSGYAQTTALQISVIIIGLPVFLIHWRWAQRLAAEEVEERSSLIRVFFLYATLAAGLGPSLANLFSLLVKGFIQNEASTAIPSAIIAIIVLAVVFYYFLRVLQEDESSLGGEPSPLIRRLYELAFNTAGLVMAGMAVDNLLSILIVVLRGNPLSNVRLPVGHLNILTESVRVLIGLGIWLYFWNRLQKRFSDSPQEQTAVERKVYLYLLMLVTLVAAVSNATALFAGWLRQLLDLPSRGRLEDVLPAMLVAAVIWAYHSYVLRTYDRAISPQEEHRLRRIYTYMVAAVGLMAAIGGLAGELTVLINTLFPATGVQIGSFNNSLRENLAWSTAALIAGLPTWLLPWRQVLGEEQKESTKTEQRRSLARRIYLYLFLFISVMTILGSLITIVYQLLLLLFGERTPALLVHDLALAVSYAAIAAAVLVYHVRLLRADEQHDKERKADSLRTFNILVLDGGDGQLGIAVSAALKDELKGVEPVVLGLTKTAQTAIGDASKQSEQLKRIKEASLIVAPWAALAGDAEISAKVTEAFRGSAARKLLLPLPNSGLDWVGQEGYSQKDWVRQTTNAVKQIMAGDEVSRKKGWGCGTIVGILIGLVIILNLISLLANALMY